MISTIKRILGPRLTSQVARLLGRHPAVAVVDVYSPPEFVRQQLAKIENDPRIGSRTDALAALRKLGLDDFASLLLYMPNNNFANLSGFLPAMAAKDVQLSWTGSSGMHLLKQTLDFVRSMVFNYVSLSGRALSEAKVLDFGCGYGRIARLMYYFVDEANFYGVDPWQKSIDLCNQAGLNVNFLLSDYLPTSLPVGETRFDLMYAFSVFTHLSERATLAALKTLRKYVTDSGLLVITIRPVEYWRGDPAVAPAEKTELEQRHRDAGFAFRPHPREAVDGDVTYGDTSMTFDWLSSHAPEWSIAGIDRSLNDAVQIYVFLRPAAVQ
jgi:SAM-dependent methyltransferase